MDTGGPMFDPGDQKVIGQGFSAPSSQTANRAYFILSVGLTLLGVGCLFIAEHTAGILLFVAGVVPAMLLARAELSERAMLRRMRQRAERRKPE